MATDNLTKCLAYLSKIPPAISGSGGHAATLRAAAECVRFGLSEAEALEAMTAYNKRCSPPWTEKELAHKLESARRKAQPGARVLTTPTPNRPPPARLQVKPVTAAELRAAVEARRAERNRATEQRANNAGRVLGGQCLGGTLGGQPQALGGQVVKIRWPPTVRDVVTGEKWERLPDGGILAEYTPEELEWAMRLMPLLGGNSAAQPAGGLSPTLPIQDNLGN